MNPRSRQSLTDCLRRVIFMWILLGSYKSVPERRNMRSVFDAIDECCDILTSKRRRRVVLRAWDQNCDDLHSED